MSTVNINHKKCVFKDLEYIEENGKHFIEFTYKAIKDGEEYKVLVQRKKPNEDW